MNTNDIVSCLRACAEPNMVNCNESCPLYEAPHCVTTLNRSAADLIESLQAQLAESQRREQAAVTGLYYLCGNYPNAHIKPTICAICKHRPKNKRCPRQCFENTPTGDNLWEWRGVED